jgi:hypothetical protein
MRLRSIVWPLVICATLLFILVVWTDAAPFLRGPAEWRWTLRALTLPAWRFLVPLASLVLYAVIAARWIALFPTDSARPARRGERGFLIFLTIAAPLIQVALAAAVWHTPLFEFFANTTSPSVTGFYSVAITTPDLPAQLPDYAAFMTNLPIHPQTHPPGIVLLHWLGWRGFELFPTLADGLAMPLRTLQCHNAALMALDNAQIASAVTGMIIPVLGGLTVWPLYALGRRLIGARRAALAAAIFPVLPMFVMWPAQWDQIFPLFLLAGLYFIHTGLETRSTWRFLLAGIVFSCAAFLSIGNMIMIVVAVLYVIVWWLMSVPHRELYRPANLWRWGKQLLVLAAGCAAIWLIYVLVYRVNPSDLLAVGDRLLHESTRCPICPSTNRAYGLWVVWNIVDFAIFLSLPILILLVMRLPALLKKSYLAMRWVQAAAWVPLTVATLTAFIALDLTGISRGEASRIWAFFGPLFVLLALAPVKALWPSNRTGTTLLIGLIALQLFAMNTRWYTYPSFMDEPPARAANFVTPQPDLTAQVDFARQIELVGADLDTTPDHLDLNLYWEALTQPPHAYTVFVHVLDGQGNLIAQQDNMPVHDQLPTSCWLPGEQVTDSYAVSLPAEGPQPALLEIGLYQLDTGERLARTDGAGTSWSIILPQR